MRTEAIQIESARDDAWEQWRAELRRAGLVAFTCAPTGRIERGYGQQGGHQAMGALPMAHSPLPDPQFSEADWLSELLLGSPILRQAVEREIGKWTRGDREWAMGNRQQRASQSQFNRDWGSQAPSPQPSPRGRGQGEGQLLSTCELFPGCWMAASPVLERRRVVRWHVTIILTGEFTSCEQLAAMCQTAGQDFQLVRSRIAQLPPVAACDVERVAGLVRLGDQDRVRMEADARTMESVSQQLGESYEEINLLYTIIANMTVVQQPERFVTETCEELLETLPYSWVGAQLCDDAEWLKKLRGRLIIAGQPPGPPGDTSLDELQRLAMVLLSNASAETPIVLEPALNAEHSEFSPLGRTAAIHPVSRDGRVIGLLIAGEKRSDASGGSAVSSVDMKLLGAAAAHMAIFLENAALYDDLNAMFLGTLEALSASIDAKDRYTCGHSQRVANLSVQLGRAAGLDAAALNRLRIAGLVHDVGKIGVPESVLCKPGRLTAEEFDWIRKHPEMGHRILRDIPQLKDVLPAVLHHHERWDGAGYPHRLAGSEIPFIARLIALADAFDAMSSDRAYRSSLTRSQVLREIRQCAGTQFDPTLAKMFVNLNFEEYDVLIAAHRAAEPALQSGMGIDDDGKGPPKREPIAFGKGRPNRDQNAIGDPNPDPNFRAGFGGGARSTLPTHVRRGAA